MQNYGTYSNYMTFICEYKGVDSVNLDEKAHYEPHHLVLRCLQIQMVLVLAF